MRKKARLALWVKAVANEELTKEKEGRARKQSSQGGQGEKVIKIKKLVESRLTGSMRGRAC